MDAQEYYQSLLSQGYTPEIANTHTQQHYPEFVGNEPVPQIPVSQAPTSPPPVSMMMNTPNLISGTPNMPIGGLVIGEPKNKGKKFHIINGVCGILLSLLIMVFSYSISSDYRMIGNLFGVSQFNTLGNLWMLVLLIGVSLFAISIIQFMDKPWGSKAMLISSGILLAMLLVTGFQEHSTFSGWGDETDEEELTYLETNGTFLSFCAAPCFGIFTLFAFLGREKTPPVLLQTGNS